jgi:dipeptidyl aminopeptidase/acylaminoacyl peptidase
MFRFVRSFSDTRLVALVCTFTSCFWTFARAEAAETKVPTTLEDRMGIPIVSSIVPVQGRPDFAWIYSLRGKQTVYLGNSKARHAVASFDKDDGRGLGQLGVTPDEKFVFFSRSAYGEERTDSSVLAARNTLYIVGTAGTKIQKAIQTSASDVVASPDGHWLLYTSGGAIWRVDLADPALTSTKVLDVRGLQRDLTFSPDGQKVAFVSNRSTYGSGNYSFVAVYDLLNNHLTYISPGLAFDQDPVWSPDGKRVAFLRVPMPPGSYRFGEYLTGPPFSLVVADPDTGVGHTVFTAPLGQGSVFNPMTGTFDYDRLYLRSNLFWDADNRLIFPWEKTGWRLLYAISVDKAGPPELLVPGEFEFLSANLSRDRSRLLVTANAENLFRPRAWLLDLKTKTFAPVQAGGMQRAIDWCGDAKCVLVKSWKDDAPYPLVATGDLITHGLAAVDQSTEDAGAGATRGISISTFRFTTRDGLTIDGVMYKPAAKTATKPLPVIVLAHGGSRGPTIAPGATMTFGEAVPLSLVDKGYAYVAINYRSGEGYGLRFRETPAYGGKSEGHGDIDDFVDLAAFLAKDRALDVKRMGVFGGSYGGYLVTNLLARHSDLYAAGASLYGVGDWVRELEQDTGLTLNMNVPMRMDVEALMHRSSATSQMDTWKSPLFLAQGDGDTDGHMEADISFWTGLTQRGVPVEAHVYPNEQHGFSRWTTKLNAYGSMEAFFDKYLASEKH